MELISVELRDELFDNARDLRKIELADYYAADEQTFAAWKAGEKVHLAGWREDLDQMVREGRTWRRVRVVSEPLSDYQRMALEISIPEEDSRWLPRHMISAVPLPGNDCFIFDSRTAVFNILDGSGSRASVQISKNPDVVKFCLDSFHRAWNLATPNGEYHP